MCQLLIHSSVTWSSATAPQWAHSTGWPCSLAKGSVCPYYGFILSSPETSIPLGLLRRFHWFQGEKIKKSGFLTQEKHSVVKAQGDTVFGGRRRSILLNWGNGWGPSFGTGRSGEASSSKLHHPDPHHLLPHFCFRRTFLGENTTELRFLQNIFF